MEELDVNRDKRINEDEFVSGLSEWLNTTYNELANSDQDEDENNYKKTWEQTDKLLEYNLVDKSVLAWMKALTLIVVGFVMLGLLAEPLIQSVRKFSTDSNVPSFYVAFVFVPLATNARIAVSAISESVKKKATNHFFDNVRGIYGTVVMNNVLGLVVLLSLVYFRNLVWTFSAEVLIVLIVSSIVGSFASFNSVYPLWTSILAYFLYPLSLALVYILGHFDV
ncbi:hypothetical protein CASFOL_017887 [Castilleja foliolosa]|uniref:EF-hand domain-containing protein n=1 Tax=Castilleja foliolosa TaxID=1961234 RepID=A0ABD3DC36_9LAMI